MCQPIDCGLQLDGDKVFDLDVAFNVNGKHHFIDGDKVFDLDVEFNVNGKHYFIVGGKVHILCVL